ncbi:replicative DNA helicase [Spirochaetia bacterium]|nr:replicative DNA helicase [Spirochaetia bacterium]
MANDSRVPPHDDEAERATLGALLLNGDAIETVRQFLQSDNFSTMANKLVFKAIFSLYKDGHPADIITVMEELRHAGDLDRSGGPAYVASLTNGVPSSVNVEHYAKIVLDRSVRRSLLNIANQIIADVYDESIEYRTILEQVQQKIFYLTENNQTHPYKKLDKIVPELIDEIDAQIKSGKTITGIPSGFYKLDEITFGFQPSDYIVIGARPSVGKTALALTMADHIAVKKKIPTAFFSLEMSDKSLVRRLLSSESKIDSENLRIGMLKVSDYQKLQDGAALLYEAPLYIVDSPNMKLLDLRAQARRLRMQEKVEIIFVDYMTLVTPENTKLQTFDQFAEVSKALKSLARELDIPIVVLSQLNRDVKEDKEPELSNIRASGAIEQDADLVLLLRRKKGATEAMIDVAKQRNGKTGLVDIVYLPQYTRFENLERENAQN